MKSSALVLALVVAVGGCAGVADEVSEEPGDGPGGSGVVEADPDSEPAAIRRDSACELAASNATLAELGAVGEPADTQFIVALSYCQLTLDLPPEIISSVSLEILAAADVVATVNVDTEVAGISLVPLPDLGENGHFISVTPDIRPADDPRSGAIAASQGDLGVVLSWSLSDSVIPFATFEQAVRDALDELP